MEEELKKIERLLTEGRSFTYANFCSKTQYNNVASFGSKWVTWTTRVDGAITSLFGKDSASATLVKRANNVRLIGNGPDKFEQALSYYLGALETAIETLKEDTFNEIGNTRPRLIATQPIGPENTSTDSAAPLSREVFIVHGHDDAARLEVSALVSKAGLVPIVLHEQANKGQTVIEKLEEHSEVSFAVVLLTPDDVGGPVNGEMHPRARQNVIAELFYFIGILGRSKVCALVKGDVEIPSDIGGIVYVPFDSHDGWKAKLLRELEAAGHSIDWRVALR